MKKLHILTITAVLALAIGSLSFSGANAEENSNSGESKTKSSNSSTEFKGSSIRSHGYPVANMSASAGGTNSLSQDASVGNDDANSELVWQQANKANESSDKKATGNAKVLGSIASSPIVFHIGGFGGIYSGPVQIIPVWVGTWSDARKAAWNSILGNLVTSLGGTGDIATANQVFNTNTLYFTTKTKPTAKLTWSTPLIPSATVPAKLAAASGGIVPVSDANVAQYINLALTNATIGAPSAGSKAIYLYLGAADTRLSSGFGTAYCGWHTYGTLGASNIPYIAIQDFTSTYYSACSAQTVTPNLDIPLDAMASVLVHEIDESITDADLRTWYDSRGAENADKCAWSFGATTLLNGAKYNFTAGGKNYLIQRNWLANNIVTDISNGSACVTKN